MEENLKKSVNENYKEYVKTFKSDMYIMIPYTSYIIHEQLNADKVEDEISKEFVKCMNEYSCYGCNNKVTEDFKRIFIGKNQLACFNYEYDKNVVEKENVYLFLTQHKSTGLYILTIADFKNEYSPTQLEDQVTTNEIFVYDEQGKKINIDIYMENEFNLKRCGDAKTLLAISNKPEEELEFRCILASETYKNFIECESYYKLMSKEIKEASNDNFSQYDFYDIYASKSAVVYVLKTFNKDDVIANIRDEVPILFIVELIMFQSASVLRTNRRIIEKLSKNGTVSLKFIENLYKEFGKTIRFWDKDVFKYITVQNISSKINKAFETNNILEEYYKNQSFLEHIVNLRDIQNSNKESKILNIIVLILTLIQVVPIFIEFINWIFNTGIRSNIFNYAYIIDLSLLIVVVIIIVLKRKKDKRKRNMEI